MTLSQTPFLSEIEAGRPIPLGKLAYLRERTRNVLYDFIVTKFIKASEQGLSQAELARRIGKKPEVINRWLSSPGNWRIDTISDLLVGIDAEELEPHSVSLLDRAPRNQIFPEWLTNHQPSLEPSRQPPPPLEGEEDYGLMLGGQGQLKNVDPQAVPTSANDQIP